MYRHLEAFVRRHYKLIDNVDKEKGEEKKNVQNQFNYQRYSIQGYKVAFTQYTQNNLVNMYEL